MSNHECPGCRDGLHPKVLSIKEWQEEYLNLVIYTASVLKQNDTLRELVEDMLDCIEIRMTFDRPPTSEIYEGFAQRAGELGIEVDDD